MEPEETTVAKQRLVKQISMPTNAVLRSEAELMGRYYFGMVDQGKESVENKFFEDFGWNG
jgi:hypothetical protein